MILPSISMFLNMFYFQSFTFWGGGYIFSLNILHICHFHYLSKLIFCVCVFQTSCQLVIESLKTGVPIHAFTFK